MTPRRDPAQRLRAREARDDTRSRLRRAALTVALLPVVAIGRLVFGAPTAMHDD